MVARNDPVASVGLHPAMPLDGLSESLSAWIGRGLLWEALAAPAAGLNERRWSARDLEIRAHCILFERMVPLVARWSSSKAAWSDLLPASRLVSTATRDAPFSGVSWLKSRVCYGLPPNAFLGRTIERNADMMIMTALRWTLDGVFQVHQDAAKAYLDIDLLVGRQIEAAREILETTPVCFASAEEPGRPELNCRLLSVSYGFEDPPSVTTTVVMK